MRKKIIAIFPRHKHYVEVFGGAAHVLFAKVPSPIETYNDIDSGLVNFFRVLRDPEKFAEFRRLVELTPYSREEYEFCKEHVDEGDPAERARRFFVAVRMAFSGILGNEIGTATTSANQKMATTTSRYLGAIAGLPEIHRRIMRVQIEHLDGIRLIKKYDTPETLFYLDPPYIHETRKGGKYRHEMTDEQHRELVKVLLEIDGMAILSGYEHEIYQPLIDAGWEVRKYSKNCCAIGRTRDSGNVGAGSCSTENHYRTEVLYSNPRCVDNREQRRLL